MGLPYRAQTQVFTFHLYCREKVDSTALKGSLIYTVEYSTKTVNFLTRWNLPRVVLKLLKKVTTKYKIRHCIPIY